MTIAPLLDIIGCWMTSDQMGNTNKITCQDPNVAVAVGDDVIEGGLLKQTANHR